MIEGQPRTAPAIVRRVVPYLSAHRARFSGGVALTMLGIGLDLAKPVPLALVVDVVLSGKPLPEWLAPALGAFGAGRLLTIAAIAMVAMTVLRGFCTLASNYLTIDVGQRMVNDLRVQLFSHLQKLSLEFHYRQQLGDLLFRVMADTFSIQGMVMNGLLPLVSAAFMLGGMFWVMLGYDAPLATVALFVCPMLYAAIQQLTSRIHGQAAASKQAESDLYSRAETSIGAVKLVQAYGREDRALAEFRQGSERSLALSLRLYSIETVFILVVDSVLALGTAVLVYLGAQHVLEGRISIGHLTIFLSYLKDLYSPILNIAQNLKELSTARAGLDRVFDVLDVEPDIQDAPGAQPLPPVRGEIRLENVSFEYQDGTPVLSGLDLHVRAGERVALVGRTGAGKSTLVSLVLRFFDPKGGRVSIDGHDLRHVTLRSLRRQITLMLQEPILFQESIRDNISLGDPVPLSEVREAARRAEAEPFILEMKHGYDSVLGQDGMTLSGGQRQRLSLARTLLRSTPILILDEPTSSLDLATEAAVWHNIEQTLAGRTALVIAHRLSTARRCDRIVVLEKGAIVEQGTHDELLAQDGMYAALWRRHAEGASLDEDDLVVKA